MQKNGTSGGLEKAKNVVMVCVGKGFFLGGRQQNSKLFGFGEA